MIKFLHCGDIHLDTPFSGLRRINENLQKQLLKATKESFEKIIHLAIYEKVDFLLISGDLFDNASRSLESQLRCKKYFELLQSHEIKVFLIGGNHDPLGEPFKVDWPQNTYYFSRTGETIQLDIRGEKVFIHGISFGSDKVEQDLSKELPQALYGGTNIGLLHCDVGGSVGFYSSCSLSDLKGKNYDYFALGHIHKSEILSAAPYIVYSGCHQGKNIKETGDKGCFLVKIQQGQVEVEFKKTNTIDWIEWEIDVTDMSVEELYLCLQKTISHIEDSLESKGAIIRFILNGRGVLHNLTEKDVDEIISELNEETTISKNLIWVDSIMKETLPKLELQKLQEQDPFIGTLLDIVQSVHESEETQEELFRDLQLLSKGSMRKITGDLDKEQILNDAQNLLVSMLSKGGI